ncbi:FecR family protein [Arundinibacter roseus]|uniref:FecR family protein n=1 Tax=Arundinibacter roseus TaxID=2070510 RepID=A0A4R4KDF5_9BACT|nr:FecR family protein [Arundinibacter roseus]TDB65954.1 FecR family protein [Arundinibacter roseus]
MNHPPISPELLQKYLENTCTELEKKAVEQWYASLKGTSHFLDSLPEHESERIKAETFRHIQHELALIREPKTRPLVRWWAGLAAAVVLLAGAWMLYAQKERLLPVSPVATVQQSESITVPDNLTRFVNDQPRMVMHSLPDGSTVWLHAEASISYPPVFTGATRSVFFEGEGFFDVKSDKKHPFLIQSGTMQIEVLGTRFNVKALPKEKIHEVSVVSGSVAVSVPMPTTADAQKIVLSPRQQALFETQNKRLTTNTLHAELKKEIYEPVTIQFEGTAFDQVTDQLSRRFDVRIHLANPAMKTCRLTADFEQQPLAAILEMLCTSLDATYTMSGKTILIEGAACE